MNNNQFSDEIAIAERAEEQGKMALKLGLLPSFVVHYFPDNCQFYIPNENESAPLNPEQAYNQLRRLIGLSGL